MTATAFVEDVRTAMERLAAGVPAAVVAVSGGPDSVALLRATVELQRRGDTAAPALLHVAHFDHRLRKGSARDAEFVRRLASNLELPFHGGSAPVAKICRERGWNLADGARTLRYEYLTRVARQVGADAVLLGHTRDDQAETVLHQVARGAAYGRGMPERSGRILRPLLGLPRAEGLEYLRQLGQESLDDPTNRDPSLLRPWLRWEILPRLEDRIPGAGEALARHGAIQQDVAAFVRDEADRRFGAPPFRADRLAATPVALQREVLAGLLAAHGAPVEFETIERIRARLGTTQPYRTDVGNGVVVRIAYGRVDAVRAETAHAPVAGSAAPRSAGEKEVRLVRSEEDLPEGAPVDLLQQEGPLELRTRRPGDTIRLPIGTKKLSDLFVDRKIPREERDAIALIARGSDVLWVGGVATAEGVQAAPDPEERAMIHALHLAERASESGELPVGAVVLIGGAVVAEAHNENEARGDPTAHAELLALQRAAAAGGRHPLSRATLVVTLEPCPMCMGAVLEAHVGRVVYGAQNHRDGALGGVTDLTAAPWKRSVEVRGGVRAEEASRLLSEFFARRRE